MSFKTKELNEVCKELNTVLDKKDAIKYVGVKSVDVVKTFQTIVEARSEAGESIPDAVVDFYNKYFTEESSEEKTTKEETKETPMKTKDEKKKKEKKSAKKEEKVEKTKTEKTEKKDKNAEKDKREKERRASKEQREKDRREKKENKERKVRSRQETPSDSTREKSVVEALKKGGAFDSLIQKADDIYVKDGGKTNLVQAKRILERGIKYLYYAGILEVNEGKYKLNI